MVGVEVDGEMKTLSVVQGDLRVKDSEISSDAEDDTVRVSGAVICQGDCVFNCGLVAEKIEGSDTDLSVNGDVLARRGVRLEEGELTVRGNLTADVVDLGRDLTVSGDVKCTEVNVDGSIRVGGSTESELILAGRSLRLASEARIDRIQVGRNIEFQKTLKCEWVAFGGRLVGRGRLEAEKVGYGESISVDSEVKLGQICLGGSVTVGGGVIKGPIDIGGSLRSTAPLRFGLINGAGRVSLTGGQGQDIQIIYSALESEGDVSFGKVDAAAIIIRGNASGRDLNVRGAGSEISGHLELTGDLRSKDRVEVGETLKARSIRVDGITQARRVEANSIEGEEIITSLGAKADQVEITKKGRAKGPIVAGTVIVGDMARAEDIYAQNVQLRRGSQARNIYAARIDVEARATVRGEVKYTGSIQAEEGSMFTNKPEKVMELPSPPPLDGKAQG